MRMFLPRTRRKMDGKLQEYRSIVENRCLDDGAAFSAICCTKARSTPAARNREREVNGKFKSMQMVDV